MHLGVEVLLIGRPEASCAGIGGCVSRDVGGIPQSLTDSPWAPEPEFGREDCEHDKAV